MAGILLYFSWAIAALAVGSILIYNGLMASAQRVQEAWSTINTQLKRRYDLVPNLIETVKGASKHESETLEKVTEARRLAMSATDPAAKAKAENVLTGALKTIFALSENYPNLKANENFLSAQHTLEDTETKIQAARQFYNTVVATFNTRIKTFPGNIIANMFHIEEAPYFELDSAEVQQAPKVRF